MAWSYPIRPLPTWFMADLVVKTRCGKVTRTLFVLFKTLYCFVVSLTAGISGINHERRKHTDYIARLQLEDVYKKASYFNKLGTEQLNFRKRSKIKLYLNKDYSCSNLLQGIYCNLCFLDLLSYSKCWSLCRLNVVSMTVDGNII